MYEKGLITYNSNLTLSDLIDFENGLTEEELDLLKNKLEALSINGTASSTINKIRSTDCDNKFSATEYIEGQIAHMKLIHFTAEWCLPCKWLRKHTLEPLEKFYNSNDLAIFELDIDSELGNRVAKEYGITALPYMMLVNSNDCIVHEIESSKSVEEIKLLINSFK